MNSSDIYVQYLESLEAEAFEDEIAAHLGRHRHDVQPVSSLTGGDGGIDVCTHEYTHGYCCFGPTLQQYKSNAERTAAVVKKFQKDLRKIFELSESKSGKLMHDPYDSLAELMIPTGAKIKHLFLISSWVGDKRIAARIQASLIKYRNASQCRFAEPTATAVVWHPKQFVGSYFVIDERLIVAIRQETAAGRIRAAIAGKPLPMSADFDDKIQWLREQSPDAGAQIDRIVKILREAWRVAIASDDEIQRTLPALHRSVGDARQAAVNDTSFTYVPPGADVATLLASIQGLRGAFQHHLGSLLQPHYGAFGGTVADGEFANMIGICDVDWRSGGDA